jgi:hypothetical protein
VDREDLMAIEEDASVGNGAPGGGDDDGHTGIMLD